MVDNKFTTTEDFEREMMDAKKKVEIEKAIKTILECIGEDPERPGLIGTPDRIVRMYQEIFRGYDAEQKPRIATFSNGMDGIAYDSMVIDSGPFYSMCEHHMMPFFGRYVFAYIPNPDGKILGLSKIGRLIDWHAARLQIQERLVSDIVNDITEILCRGGNPAPLGVALYMEGEHLCKSMRGVKKPGKMSCCYLTGCFKEDLQTRAEFLNSTKNI